MSDATLRELERRARENPADLAVGHELARVLERCGERARATEELVRLARAGDRAAWRRLEQSRAPRPDEHGVGSWSGLARPDRARVSRGQLRIEGFAQVVGATEETIVVRGEVETVGVDARSFVERWQDGSSLALVAAAPRATFHAFYGSVTARDESGKLVGHWELDADIGTHAALGDEAVVQVETQSGHELVLLRIGVADPLWRAPLTSPIDSLDLVLLPGRIALGHGDGVRSWVEVRDAASGAGVWRGAKESPDMGILVADALGLIIDDEDRLVALDPDTAMVAQWRDQVDRRGHVPHRVVADLEHVLASFGNSVDLLERATGRRVFSVPFRTGGFTTDSALAGAHVWTALVTGSSELEVHALARETGERVASFRDALDGNARPPVPNPRVGLHVTITPFDGAVVVAVAIGGTVHFLRIEDAEPESKASG